MKTYLIYGCSLALVNFLLQLVLFILGLQSEADKLTEAQWIAGVFGLASSVAAITLGTRARRAAAPPEAEFTYGNALGAGVMISLFSTLLGTVTNFLYMSVVNPHLSDLLVESQLGKLSAKGLSGDQLDQAEKIMRVWMGPIPTAVIYLIIGMFFGTVISLVIAAFLKRPAPSQAAPA